MSAITPTIEMEGSLYAFERGFKGEGTWICKRGRCKGLIGFANVNTVVPVMVGNELTTLAKEQGVAERFNFAKMPPKPEKPEPRPRGPRKPKSKTPALMGGFNPFATGE
jgi:hypothetical protein